MAKNYDFDYIIIGSGPAGRTAAVQLARAKKRVAIIECGGFGGAEINTRDLPYADALDFAHTYHKYTAMPAVSTGSHHFNLPTLTASIDSHIESAQSELITECQNLGVTLISGFAHFLDGRTVAVEDRQYTAGNFILATGADLKASEIAGLDSVKFLDPDTALRIRRLPRFVFVAGGGPTGVQIAEFFALLGIGVIIMERGDHLLPREDEDVAQSVTNYFEKSLGVTVITGARVTAITEDHSSKIVVFMNGASEKMVRVDSIVLATGSEPFLDYGLENAGVDYKRTGIIVDKHFMTSAKHIYAIGDCASDPSASGASSGADSSTERAILQANILVNNLLHHQKLTADYSKVVRQINLQNSIATVGLNERDATARDLKYQKTVTYLKDLPALRFSPDNNGFIKVLSDRSGHHLGTTVVAPNADLVMTLRKVLTK